MKLTERHRQQIAAELRLETESNKIPSLSLELESALEKDGISKEKVVATARALRLA
jgi:hypothetical protein